MVEFQIVDLAVAGSNPVIHPFSPKHAFVAHVDRATDFESVGSTFESCQTQRPNSLCYKDLGRDYPLQGRLQSLLIRINDR